MESEINEMRQEPNWRPKPDENTKKLDELVEMLRPFSIHRSKYKTGIGTGARRHLMNSLEKYITQREAAARIDEGKLYLRVIKGKLLTSAQSLDVFISKRQSELNNKLEKNKRY